MSEFMLQLIGSLVIASLLGFFVAWRWSRFYYKRKLEENDSYWRDEMEKLSYAEMCEDTSPSEDGVDIDKEALRVSLKATLSKGRGSKKDNLQYIQGIGTKLESLLNELGVQSFEQIASWRYETILKLDEYLSFPGRIQRERWVEQAQLLATGRKTMFAIRVDNEEVPTSKRR